MPVGAGQGASAFVPYPSKAEIELLSMYKMGFTTETRANVNTRFGG
ncbi:hypothetical protein ACQCVP_10440 [Rossellomorea vietnamensis]